MNKQTIVPSAPDLDRVAIILASMSPDMVADIVRLVNTYGGSLNSMLFGPNSAAGNQTANRFLGIMSKDYIQNEDFAAVWAGLSTVFLASIRNPKMGNDQYQQTLELAFSLPSEIAEPMAKKIETYDILGPATPEGQKNEAWLSAVGRNLYEGFRKSANWAAGVLGTDWEIDQQQDYDVDFLYEMKNLGEAVFELNSRSRLMKSQAALAAGMGIMQMGDAADSDDSADAIVGDALAPFMTRNLPTSITGNAAPVIRMGLSSAGQKARRVFNSAGLAVSKEGQVAPSQDAAPKNPRLLNAVKAVAGINPLTAGLIGAGVGLTPTVIRGIKTIMTGDVEDGLHAIRGIYGDAIAEDVSEGDLESLAAAIEEDLTDDFTTGDPDLDDIITGEVLDAMGDAELGGPLRRLKTNQAKRRAARATRSNVRQSNKTARVKTRQVRRTERQTGKLRSQRLNQAIDRRSASAGLRPAPMDQFEVEQDQFQEDFDPMNDYSQQEDFGQDNNQDFGYQGYDDGGMGYDDSYDQDAE